VPRPKPTPAPRAPIASSVFCAIARFELAARVKAGELGFADAVDVCANAAEAAGMYELSGYVLPGGYVITGADLVQVILAECFGPVRQAAGLAP
jgi:hypothetical protein